MHTYIKLYYFEKHCDFKIIVFILHNYSGTVLANIDWLFALRNLC